MSNLQLTAKNGRTITMTNAEKLDTKNFQDKTKAALHNKQDDVLVSVGKDVYLASGKLGDDFRVTSAKLDGRVATVQSIQWQSEEPNTVGKALLNGMTFSSFQAGAATGLVGLFPACFIFRNMLTATMEVPFILGTMSALAVVGFLGFSLYQGYTGNRLTMPNVAGDE